VKENAIQMLVSFLLQLRPLNELIGNKAGVEKVMKPWSARNEANPWLQLLVKFFMLDHHDSASIVV
jgi:hypothetical protein